MLCVIHVNDRKGFIRKPLKECLPLEGHMGVTGILQVYLYSGVNGCLCDLTIQLSMIMSTSCGL